MKKILGLDLGTTSIGWALVQEVENGNASIEKVGVRIIPLSADEENDFQKGKSTSLNANRTSKRGMRRNLDRYQQRRNALKEILLEHKIISPDTVLTNPAGKGNPFFIWETRSKAAVEQVTLDEFARVLFAINKKRGYKSNRKAKDEDEGEAVDGMDLAKKLFENQWTPGQLMLDRLEKDKKGTPDFYRSDLQAEFDQIWNCQKAFYPELLTDDLKTQLFEKNKKATYVICKDPFQLAGIKRTTKGKEQVLENCHWRVKGLSEHLDLEVLTIVFQEINGQISKSSGYLGKISDRSKELYFKDLTVGQYLYKQIQTSPHNRLKGQVFYRQDYLDEFERIWETQARFHPQLTPALKSEIRDIIIFYQRRLKSQKGLISICELEGKEITVIKDGKEKVVTIGPKVCPKSSPLFQEAKIWQKLNDLLFKNIITKENLVPSLELKQALFEELNISEKMSPTELLKSAGLKAKEGWGVNFKNGLDGNHTNAALYKRFKEIVELSGHEIDWKKQTALETKTTLADVFSTMGINPALLEFNTDLEGHAYTQQIAYRFWHLLYSSEGDDSKSGNEKLVHKLKEQFGFDIPYAKLLAKVVFKSDYGSVSTKALLKIIPFLKAGHQYSKKNAGDPAGACEHAGYNPSNALSREENQERQLSEDLKLLKKNSLRNPVVEKILNQLINLVNGIIETYGKPDEIRIELGRELKKSAKERFEMTQQINKANRKHDDIRKRLESLPPFNQGVRITQKDVVKYKLWEELVDNGYKTIYTNTAVPLEQLFSKNFDVEHIIPKARLFDDSFSNKTLSTRHFNAKKGNKTGVDAVAEYCGEEKKEAYLKRVEKLFKNEVISKAKYLKLKMTESEIPDGFIERDMRNSQYIAKKALEILHKVCHTVTPTSGGITAQLRQDWQLIHVMQELNWKKYEALGLVEYEKTKDGNIIATIKDWTKRNDHRHHIMDAITVAFTRPSHVQYFNFLNARHDENHDKHQIIKALENKITTENSSGKRIIQPPMPIDQFRVEAKKHLESTLVSFKAKNKVTTRNKNKIRGVNEINIELTPRGQLHKETVYAKRKRYRTKKERVGASFDRKKIEKVAHKKYRLALMERLETFEGNPKKAFTGKNSLSKNPINLDFSHTTQVPEYVKLVDFEELFTIRKEVDSNIRVDKVIDAGVRGKLQKRLDAFGGNAKKAFSNLDVNPIWLNQSKGIRIKRVSITGVSNAMPLHTKKDHFGNPIVNKDGLLIPTDYVSTGNNHHVAIYQDADGNLQEQIVSFFEAVVRRKQGLYVIDKSFNADLGWKFLFTMKQNEMFVFPNPDTGFDPAHVDLENPDNYTLISPNLFRVQKIATKNYFFRHHLETTVETKQELSGVAYMPQLGLNGIHGIIKVRINHLGQIVKVGEY